MLVMVDIYIYYILSQMLLDKRSENYPRYDYLHLLR